jgi:hypothetical protein
MIKKNPKLPVYAGAAIALCLLLFLVISHFSKPDEYRADGSFTTGEIGRAYEGDLSEPTLRTADVMYWAAGVVTDTMRFSFRDNPERLQDVSRHFTTKGWANFTASLKRTGLIETLKTNQMSVAPVQKGPPTLRSEGVVDHRYQWAVDVPIMITTETKGKTRAQNLLVTLIVVRIPPDEGGDGIAVEKWVATPL